MAKDIPEMPVDGEAEEQPRPKKRKRKSVRTYVQKAPRTAYMEPQVMSSHNMNPYSRHYNPNQMMMQPDMKPYGRLNNTNRQQMSLAYKQIDNMAKQATYAF